MEAAPRPVRKLPLGTKLFVCAMFAVLIALDPTPFGIAFVVGVGLLITAYRTDNLGLRKYLVVAAFVITIGFALAYEKYSRGFSRVTMLWISHTLLHAVRNGKDVFAALVRGHLYPLSILATASAASMILMLTPSPSRVLFLVVIGISGLAGLMLARVLCGYIAAETKTELPNVH